MAEGQWQGRSAIVTGGGSGIGLGCARVLAQGGARLMLVGRTEARLEAALQSLPGSGHAFVVGDAADEGTVSRAVALADSLAPLAVGIASAGRGSFGPVTDTTVADFDAVMQTNVNGVFLLFKHAGAAIGAAGGGALCAISSIAGLRTHRLMGTYCASKAAVDSLVRNAADELGTNGVRVNSVCPGLVATELSDALMTHDAVREDYLACMPVARTGTVDDIAQAVGFLCSPQASWITGVSMPVDGGHHLRRGPDVSLLLQQ
ncbi:MAG: SDR family oxidoreductase [Pseudomonadota bacterium]